MCRKATAVDPRIGGQPGNGQYRGVADAIDMAGTGKRQDKKPWRERMKSSKDRILTSHAGSLPRPDALIEANRSRTSADGMDEAQFQALLRTAVSDVVGRQKAIGVNLPGDGEFGKSMGHRVNYGAWWSYSFQRLSGLMLSGPGLYEMPARRSQSGEVVLTSFADRRDRLRFAAAYNDPESGVSTGPRRRISRSASDR